MRTLACFLDNALGEGEILIQGGIRGLRGEPASFRPLRDECTTGEEVYISYSVTFPSFPMDLSVLASPLAIV